MKKNLIFALIALAVTSISCKNNDNDIVIPKQTYVNKITEYDGGDEYISNIVYDSQNRIVEVNGTGWKNKYTYDSQNRIIKLEDFQLDKLSSNEVYTYEGNKVTITFTENYNDQNYTNVRFLTLNDKNQVISSYSQNYPENITTYTYDAKGNLIEEVTGNSKITYTYDNHPHPLSSVKVPFGYENESYVNNLIGKTYYSMDEPYISYTYPYKYNNEGFPIEKDNVDGSVREKYEYVQR